MMPMLLALSNKLGKRCFHPFVFRLIFLLCVCNNANLQDVGLQYED